SKLSGTVVNGQARITSDQATVRRVKAGQSEFNEITARDLAASFGPDVSKGRQKPFWTFSIGQTQARSFIAGEISLTSASASNVRGTVIDGRAQITSDQATVERAKAGQTEFNEITARDLAASFGQDGSKRQWTFSIGQTQARSVLAEGNVFTTASASNVRGTIVGGRAQVTSSEATVERAEARLGVFNKITLLDISATLAT